MEIVLASGSPRRRELMARVTPEFRVYPVNVDESSVVEKDPLKFAVAAAVLKARAAAEAFPAAIVIGADTVVALGGRILGKPHGRDSARAMLRLLSGRRHRVITGLAFYRKDADRLLTGSGLTYITFRELSDEMIERYLDQGDFRDKAGAYAVQDVGDAFVGRMKGDYTNVVGFPVKKVAAMLARFEAGTLTVAVEDINFPGPDGVAREAGRTVLITDGVPGETLTVQVVGEGRGFLRAEAVRLEKPSPARVAPRCPHFGECGGCLFQHLDYTMQLELKGCHLQRTLEAAGIPANCLPELGPVTPSPDLYGYRNKMEFAFAERWEGLVLGLRERAKPGHRSSGRTVAVSECPIFDPAVEPLFPVILGFAGEKGLASYSARTGFGVLRHLVLRRGRRTGELMTVLVTGPAGGVDFGDLAERLAATVPWLSSFYHVVNSRPSDAVVFEDTQLLWGAPSIEERLGGLTFRITPQAFFQTNTAAAELLYQAISERAGLNASRRVLGLYCGSGTIELSLARGVRWAAGVDSLPENIRTAQENQAANGILNAEFLLGAVEGVLKNPPSEPPDVLVLDPPRPGLTPKAVRSVLALDVPRVAYVSCNPESLARDLREFLAAGYRIEVIVPFDFFPHTPHLETLAILSK
jgi:23S rRNA (uracil1939-C5)-methyltransferase